MHHPQPLPTSRHFPDPQHFADLERLGHEITELAAHIHAATFQLLELIRKVLEGVMEELDTEQKDEPECVSAETPEGVDLCEAQPHPIAVRRADALERIAESYLARQSGDRSGGDRYMVHIHTEADTLKADGESAESELEERGCVSAETWSRWRTATARMGWILPMRPCPAGGRVSRWTTIWRFWGFRAVNEVDRPGEQDLQEIH